MAASLLNNLETSPFFAQDTLETAASSVASRRVAQVENEILVQLVGAAVRGEPERQCLEIPEDMDWVRFFHQVTAHTVGPIVYERLKHDQRVPESILVALRDHCEAIARSNLHHFCELVRLMRALKAANIPALAYKGPTLAHAAYGSLALRRYADLDILVPKKYFLQGVRVLQENEYRISNELPQHLEKWWLSTQHDYSLTSQKGAELVELHWDVTEHQFAFRFDVQDMWQRRRPSTASPEIDTLSTEDLLVVLCVHASKHGWQRLVWISDVAAVLQQALGQNDLNWEVLIKTARKASGLRALYVGLLLTRDFLRLPELLETMPPVHKTRMENDILADMLRRQVEKYLFLSPETRDNAPFPSFIYFLRLRESNVDKIKYAWRRTTELNTRDFVLGDLPPHLHGLYYIVRAVRLFVKAAKWMGQKCHLIA